MAGYAYSNTPQNTGQNRGLFSKTLRNISNWGMNYEDLVAKNAVAVGINQIPTAVGATNNMYDVFSRNAALSLFEKKSIAYLDKSLGEKMVILNQYARKDEIRDFITLIADESIMYDESTEFCSPITLSNDFGEQMQEGYAESFKKIYQRFGFNDGTVAWNYFRKLLINGYLAFEIIYDDKFRSIEVFQQIPAETLLPIIDPNTGDRIWIQYPENPEIRRTLLDCQIIYISYSSGNEFSETSYVENLIRPYNQLKLLEETRIMFNVTNAMTYKKFVVPVGGLSRNLAEEQISKLISDYKEEVTFNQELGTPQVNGSPDIPYAKEYWFPGGEGGEPTVELIQQEGHNLNENDMLVYFYNNLKRSSKIPFSRFDKTNGGGNIFGDTSEVSREELNFFNFISRLRTVFKEIIVKPWRLQLMLDYPEMRTDENFTTNINVEFNGVNMFHEWKKLNNLSKRAEVLGTLSSSIQDAEGQPYFHIEWLVREVLKLDEEEIKENEKWKKRKANGAATPGGGGDAGTGGDSGGISEPDFSGGTEPVADAAPEPAADTPEPAAAEPAADF